MKSAVRNILLVGNAGKGKSTLANILTEFKESADRINGNDEAKSKEFKYEELKYQGLLIQQDLEFLTNKQKRY